MARVWEVIVERKITNTFRVEARSRSEAAAVVGMALGRDECRGVMGRKYPTAVAL